MKPGGVYIISVWNRGGIFEGIHTVAFTCDNAKNIIVYNRYSNIGCPLKYDSKNGRTGLDIFLDGTGGAIVMYEVK